MVVFDATVLLPLLWPNVPPPRDPITNDPVTKFRERIDHLIDNLEKSRTKILIPTPALSEILVRAGTAGPQYLAHINSSSVFRVVPFDERAAVEVAAMTHDALKSGDKRAGGEGAWTKIKYDRQIVAIAKAERVITIYSDDGNVRKFGTSAGLSVIRIAELPLPPEDAQRILDLDAVSTHATNEDAETEDR